MLGWSKLYSVTVGQFGPQMHDSDSDKDVRMLDRHPEVRKLFIKYNTAITSSAPVERLFSSGALVLSKRRNRLSDSLFETRLLSKVNVRFWLDWDC